MQVTHLSLNAFRGEIFIATAFLTKKHLSNIILKLSVRELHNHNNTLFNVVLRVQLSFMENVDTVLSSSY